MGSVLGFGSFIEYFLVATDKVVIHPSKADMLRP